MNTRSILIHHPMLNWLQTRHPMEEECLTLVAIARIPSSRRAIAIDIHRLAVAIDRFDARHRAVSHIGLEQAVVCVVGRAEKDKGRIHAGEVAIGLFPVTVGVKGERVVNHVGLTIAQL